MKTEILDFFYEHTGDYEWHEGLDLFTSGKVEGVKAIHDLITCKVQSHTGASLDVRLKIDPNGRFIQWLECTCRKNRTTGQYCEHITAMMVCIQHDHPKLLNQLDKKMPIKVAPPAKKQKKKENTELKPTTDKQDGATQAIISHLRNIHSIKLRYQGPCLNIRAEIKAGEFANYTLELDEAARFLEKKPKLTTASEEVKKLKVHTSGLHLGTRIYQLEEEKIVAERVVGFKVSSKTSELDESSKAIRANHRFCTINPPSNKDSEFELYPIKSVGRNLGQQYFFLPSRGYWAIPTGEVSAKWFELPHKKTYKEDQAAELVADGFQFYLDLGPIWLDENLSNTLIHNDTQLSEIRIQKSEAGWFYLDPSYGDPESQVSMIDLMNHFQKKKRQYIKTGNKWVKIPEFIKEHQWSLDDSGKFIKVDALGLMRFKAAIGDFDQFVGSKRTLNEIRKKLHFTPEGKLPPIKKTKLQLREYQETGLKWLWWLYENGLHGLLADEMGLGKTHQAMGLMAAIQHNKPEAKFLVLAPTTVLDHWEDKVRDFCPSLTPIKHHGSKRSANLTALMKDHALMITSYGVLLRDAKAMSEIPWAAIILDEAHFVKNNDTATYRAVCRIPAEIRICLTGTPMENHLGEIKNIFDFLLPGYLGSDEYFKRNFIEPITKQNSDEVEETLQKLIYPFKMRRIKSEVLKDLPEKVEDKRHCNLSAEQVKLYKKILDMKARPLLEQLQQDTNPVPYLHVFATLTLLKQICNHPALISENADYKSAESGKFEVLKEILEEALGSGHKVVIYSQYLTMIKMISQYLSDLEVEHAVLTGTTRKRGKVIERFQTDPNCKVFIGSLLAGGVGVDLTAASVVVHYDRWWNASKENQATDRVYRIGQNKNVQVMKLITRGTLEEKIDLLIESKKELFEKFMDRDENLFKSFTRSQLIELLQ